MDKDLELRIDNIETQLKYMNKLLEDLTMTFSDRQQYSSRLQQTLRDQVNNMKKIIDQHPAVRKDPKSAEMVQEIFNMVTATTEQPKE